MVVALVISLILNILLIGVMLWINESWYRDVVKVIETCSNEYSRLNNEWAEICKEQIDYAVNSTVDAMKETKEGTEE